VLPGEVGVDSDTMTPPGSAAFDGPEGSPAELAEALTGEAGQLTQAGILVGTPMYMAPELSEGSHLARPPSDVFSLGMIAYELFSGEIPFARPPVWARWRGRDAPAPSLAVRRPDLPGEVVALIDSCLRLDPALRPTADAIATALRGRVESSFFLS
jgi:serine/threonine-protein kinase